MEARAGELDRLRHEVAECEGKFNEILAKLNWTREGLANGQVKRKKAKAGPESCEERTEDRTAEYEKASEITERSGHYADLAEISAIVDRNKELSRHFTDLNKLKRDLKRRRMKYRTTKCPPITYTEEIRELIGNLMEIETTNACKEETLHTNYKN